MEYCQQHITLSTDIASIKTSVANIEKQLTQSVNFKTTVVMGFISTLVLMVAQLVSFAYFYGQMSNQIIVNTARLHVLEKVIK